MYNANEEEKKILAFWDQDKTFEKSVNSRPENKPYVFYDGPPFATGLPHYGHIVASAMKDVVPRFWTMRGFRVDRKWGWDCHGLPIENIIEKDLELHNRRDIENYGIAKFNEACRATVLKYAEDWKKTIRRMGRWVDMEHDYKTMDPEFMESVWWVFKQLWDHDYVYKGHKPMHICPRCATTLSNFEVTQGYKDVKDLSATVKFKLKQTHQKQKMFGDEEVSILAWTTTPWTLPGNVLLAVGKDIDYLVIKADLAGTEQIGSENKITLLPGSYIVSKQALIHHLLKSDPKQTNPFEAILSSDDLHWLAGARENHTAAIQEIKGKDLVGLEYEPLFPYFADTTSAFRVVAGDFVTTEDGTGIVHIAPGYGEDDFNLGKAENVPLVQHVNMEGRFTKEMGEFADREVSPRAKGKEDEVREIDLEIKKYLEREDVRALFASEKIKHSYPHCWRCDTPLLNYATTSWFVRVGDMRELLLKNNEKINWVPEHIKEGRFGKWLEGARDWAISRSRYWGTPLPVWESEDGEVLCLGSIAELEEHAGKKVPDIHKHLIDDIEIEHLGKKYRRVPEVFDCWFESGSMPYGQMHYPFENKEKFEAAFPAEFIAEGQDQTRGWFYTLHVLATALTSGKDAAITSCGDSAPAFKNVIVNGIVLAEDGKKMSKRLKNYPEPDIILEKYGADAMRYYLVSSPVMAAESLNFSEAGVREMFNKVVNTLANVLEFYQLFTGEGKNTKEHNLKKSDNPLDKWVLAKLQVLVQVVTEKLEQYKLDEASRPIVDFITELSQWYVRRSRDRFKGEDELDKQHALHTLREVLEVLAKLMAPFTPFIAEKIWLAVTDSNESVHLQDWPRMKPEHHEQAILDQMNIVRKIVEMGLALRAESKQKVRQPLATLLMNKAGLSHELHAIIADELNVKKVDYAEYQEVTNGWAEKVEGDISVWLDTNVTDELKKEGWLREVVRTVNQLRKEAGLTIADRVTIQFATNDESLSEWLKSLEKELMQATLATKLEEVSDLASETKLDFDSGSLTLGIVKV